MTPLGGSSKATFSSIDDGASFVVQYNPKDFKVNKGVTWAEGGDQGKDSNGLQYQKGAPMTASFELVFDTTASGNQNVQTTWVSGLLALTNADVTPKDGEPTELSKLRPRALLFQWGGFSMKCVVESINVNYTMFSSSGDAVRATCQVQLKEWVQPGSKFAAGAGGGRNVVPAARLVQASGGQTAATLAASLGVDVRVLAAINGITDPMADCTGRTLQVPTASGSARASVAGVGSASASGSIGPGGARGSVSGAFGRR